MNQKVKVHIALWIVTIIYAATFSIAKQVMPIYIKPFAFILLRVSVASVLIILFHKSFIKEKITDKKDFLKLLVCAIFGVAANMMLFFKGLSITTPINASVLMMNTPIFVIVISMIWYKEKDPTHVKVEEITATGDTYYIIDPDSAEEMARTFVRTPTIVQAGAPHTVINSSNKNRWCVSIVLKKGDDSLTFDQLVTEFKDYAV